MTSWTPNRRAFRSATHLYDPYTLRFAPLRTKIASPPRLAFRDTGGHRGPFSRQMVFLKGRRYWTGVSYWLHQLHYRLPTEERISCSLCESSFIVTESLGTEGSTLCYPESNVGFICPTPPPPPPPPPYQHINCSSFQNGIHLDIYRKAIKPLDPSL